MGRAFRAAAAVLCVALACTFAVDADKDEAVFTATGENFDQLIKDNSFVAVEFYAPWCGHCKKLAPEWEAAAKELKAKGITLAKYDCTEDGNKALPDKFGIKGFPTIKIFRDGDAESPADYDGPRETAGIVSYLGKQAGPPSLLLDSAKAVKDFCKFTDEKGTVVIGVFPGGESGDGFEAYKSAANTLRSDYDFAHVTDASFLEEAKGATEPKIVLLQEEAAEPAVYSGALTKKELAAWVEKTAAPAIVTLDQNPKNRKSLQKVFSDTKPKLLGFIAKDNKGYKAFREALIESSKATEGLAFIFADIEGNDGALSYFGITAKDTPAFVIHDQEGGDAKYISRNADPSSLAAWVKDFQAGELEKAVKSEEAPEKNDGPVTILTAKTFDDIVYGKPRNVLIEFYAPWCGHCKKLTPIYEKVGQAFADNDSVVIAKMDATANDIPDTSKFKVTGFPTLKFVTADGSIIDYAGDRSEEDLVKFVNSNADSAAASPGKDEL